MEGKTVIEMAQEDVITENNQDERRRKLVKYNIFLSGFIFLFL